MRGEMLVLKLSFDDASSTPEQPYAIITADGSNPKEIDDGLYVHKLDAETEQYRVGVCIADTSKLYQNGDIREQAMSNVHAEYWDLPNGDVGYDPMISQEHIRGIELVEGRLRSALVVSFTVGKIVAPHDIRIDFGKVDVKKNYTYKEFSSYTGPGGQTELYNRAARLILDQLQFSQGGDSAGRNKEGNAGIPLDVSYTSWARGARINEVFMVAANHLVGRALRDEKLPAIYRVHDLSDESHGVFVEANCAVYQREPGLHAGLRVDPYCRVTSPLRRLEDFIMSHHLKLRAQGKQPTKADLNVMDDAIRTLNRRTIFESMTRSPSVRRKTERIQAINAAAVAGKRSVAG